MMIVMKVKMSENDGTMVTNIESLVNMLDAWNEIRNRVCRVGQRCEAGR